MSLRLRLLILACSILLFAGSASAEQVRSYQSSASAPIIENDIAFAKHNAFQRAQYAILDSAIRDLLDPGIYEANQNQILRNQSLRPKYHLISVKILNEISEGGEYKIEIEARVQIDTLADELRKMGLVFKSDPWFPVTLLVEKGIEVDVDLFRKTLAPFHIQLNNIKTVDYTGISAKERNSKTFLENLFLNYSNKGIIYILETVAEKTDSDQAPTMGQAGEILNSVNLQSDPLISGIRLRIIRQSDLEELNSISLNLSQPIKSGSDQLRSSISELMPKLFALLTVSSVKRNTYESGLAATYNINVSGLNAPYLRSVFEHQILKERRSISSFSLVELSEDSCSYVLHSGMPLSAVTDDLLQPNPYFELKVENTEFNTISLSAFYQYTATGSDPEYWQTDETIIQEIRDTLVPPSQETDNNDGGEESGFRLNPYYIPSFTEVEPNNSIIQFNRIPSSTYILGEVSSRADEDIFELQGVEITEAELETALFPKAAGSVGTQTSAGESPENASPGKAALSPINVGQNATIYIDWIQIGKTSLAPQLKLYDENFNFINAFNLVRSQKRLRFHYTFPNTPPEKIYIRISDRIGFIQGETGGFKRYRYLIRYSWNQEDEKEPASPLVKVDDQSSDQLSPSE